MEAKGSFFAQLKNTLKGATSDGLAEGAAEAGLEFLAGEVFEEGEVLDEVEAIFGVEMLEVEGNVEIHESSSFIDSFADYEYLHPPADEPFEGPGEVS